MQRAQRAAIEAWIKESAVVDADMGTGGGRAVHASGEGREQATVMSAIDRGLAAARVVVLGESNHFVREKVDFRLFWLRRLSARYRLVLGEELGASDGARVQEYLASGDVGALDRVPTFGYRDEQRDDRDDTPTGILRGSHTAYPTLKFKAAQNRFYAGLRALQPVPRYFGFDINGGTGAGYTEISARLAAMADAGTPDAREVVRKLLQLVPGESLAAEADRIAAAAHFVAGHAALNVLIGPELDVLENTLRFATDAYPAADYAALEKPMALRESLMKRVVGRVLDGLAADEKLVLMAHAFHLQKDDGARARGPGVGPGGDIVTSLGHHVAQERGESVFAIWMLYGAGRDSQPFPDLPNTASYPRDSLNAMVATRKQELVLATASAPRAALSASIGIGHMYNQVAAVDLARQADAIHFFPEATPL